LGANISNVFDSEQFLFKLGLFFIFHSFQKKMKNKFEPVKLAFCNFVP